jgi:hypothetical protein
MTTVEAKSGRALPGSPPLFAAGILAVLLAGCHAAAPMRPVDVELQAPEKDILVYDIEISELTSPRTYRDWAAEQLAELGGAPPNERYPGVPIYEVWYRFRLGGETVAEVAFRRDEGGAGELVHAQTVVRALPERPR